MAAVTQTQGLKLERRRVERRDSVGDTPPSPEFRLLGCALAWPRTEARAAVLRTRAEAGIDWARVVRLSERHRVVGLLSHALRHAAVRPPEPERALVEQRARAVAFHELAIANELAGLVRAFGVRGISPVVLKGLSVAVQSYGQLGLRQNRDIDLLVTPSELLTAVSLLLESGYQQIEPTERLNPLELADWMRSHKDLVYRHVARAVIVELHWRLFDNLEFDRSLDASDRIELCLPSGTRFQALGEEAAFAYMSAHGAQHAWSRLKWLADFSAHCQALGPERVAGFYARLHGTGLVAGAAQGLMLAEEFFGAPAPAAVRFDARGDVRIRMLCSLARRAVGGDELMELEDKALGSTLKTLSHYLLKGGLRYWFRQASLDFAEIPKSYSSPTLRRLGPVAKAPIWIYLRARRALKLSHAARSRWS